MTVKELVEKLKDFPDDMLIIGLWGDELCRGELFEFKGVEKNKISVFTRDLKVLGYNHIVNLLDPNVEEGILIS